MDIKSLKKTNSIRKRKPMDDRIRDCLEAFVKWRHKTINNPIAPMTIQQWVGELNDIIDLAEEILISKEDTNETSKST